MALPQGFVDLAQAHTSPDNSFVNIIGVVVDVMPPTLTKTSEHMFTFKLLDRKLSYQVTGSEGLRVRFFSKDRFLLPKVQGIGDVVLLRSIKMITPPDGQRLALSNYQTGHLVFHSAAIPSMNFSISFQDKQRIECHGIPVQVSKLTLGEQQYVMFLKQDMNTTTEERLDRSRRQAEQQVLKQASMLEPPPAKKLKYSGSFGPKFHLIEQLKPGTFADVCGIVVKNIASALYGGNDLYVSDYTPNQLVRRYPPPEEEPDWGRDGDLYGHLDHSKKTWPGPFEFLILKVNLKPPHAAYANKEVKPGDTVLLRNVKMRITPEAKLEGDMWPDDLNPERIQVRKLWRSELPEVSALMDRKTEYWRQREAPVEALVEETTRSKKSKKKKKKNKSGKQPVDEQDNADEASLNAKKKDKNPHVRCSHEDVLITKVKDILDTDDSKHVATLPNGRSLVLPFMNAKYRAKVRVIDFEPKSLLDFAISVESEHGSDGDSMAWQYDTPGYEWYFALLLEDATSLEANRASGEDQWIWVQVHHEAAQFLLGNEVDNPDDLRSDSQLLAKLREKLFVLWGNLEEKGGEELSNLPFECCIAEYGVEMERDNSSRTAESFGWRRMYSMFGTTIL